MNKVTTPPSKSANASTSGAGIANSNNGNKATTTTAAKTTAQVSIFRENNISFHLFSLLHFLAAFACIFLVQYGNGSETFHFTAIYDLLFTDKISSFAHFTSNATSSSYTNSFILPALLSLATRPLSLILDNKVRAFLFNKFSAYLSESDLASVKLLFLETQWLHLIFVRVGLAAAFFYSLVFLRRKLSETEKSSTTARIFSLLSLALTVPFLMASRVQSSTFSMIILNFALPLLIEQEFTKAFSLLAINFAIVDSVNGLFLIIAAFVSCSLYFNKKNKKNCMLSASASLILSIVGAAVISVLFDSLFYNKFIWPQGDALFIFINQLITSLSTIKFPLSTSAITALAAHHFTWTQTKISLLISLLPAIFIFVFSSKSVSRGSVALYTTSVVLSTTLTGSTGLSTMAPMMTPILIAASSVFASGFKTNSRLIKAFTALLLIVLLPALFWSVGRLHVEINAQSQFGGEALMTLNSKILSEAQEGVPVRVHYDYEAATHGVNPFIKLSKDHFLYSATTSPAEARAFRPDYLIRSVKSCVKAKALNTFAGFDRVNLKALKTVTVDRVAILRASQCDVSDFEQSSQKQQGSTKKSDSSSHLLTLLLKQFPKFPVASLSEQRDVIGKYLGKYNHKKVTNMSGLVLYLYVNIFEHL